MGLQPGIMDVRRQTLQSRLNLGLQPGIFPNQAAKRPFKAGREHQFVHGSLAGPQTGDDAVHRLGF